MSNSIPKQLLHSWYLIRHALFVKGLNSMLRGLEVSRPSIANMILLVNASKFLKAKSIYIMTFGVSRWDT